MEGDQLLGGEGVQPRSERVGREVDIAVRGVGLPALEDEVLEKVSDAVLLRPLGPRAGVEGDQGGEGVGAVELERRSRSPF